MIFVAHDTNGSYGDWVVKRNGRKLSNHRMKSKAKKTARKKAKKGERIVIQNKKGRIIKNYRKQ